MDTATSPSLADPGDALARATASPSAWREFVDGDVGDPRGVDAALLAELTEQLEVNLDAGDLGFAVAGDPAAAKVLTAWAARCVLRDRHLRGRQSLWWTLTPDTPAAKVIAGIAAALGSPRPRGYQASDWTLDQLDQHDIRLAVLADLQHVLRGPGSRDLRYAGLTGLIKNARPRTLFVLLGDNLVHDLFERPGGDLLAHYVTVHAIGGNA